VVVNRFISFKLQKAGWLIALISVLAGCAETGDFGRRRPGLFEGKQGIDASPDWFGSRATLTDLEVEFRNRAVAFTYNPEKPIYPSLDAFEAVIGSDPDLYYGRIAGQADLSVTARYKRVARDAYADLALVPLFRTAACRVAVFDARRLEALAVANGVNADQTALVHFRVASNKALGDVVEAALRQRVATYHIAVERLFAASPDEEVKPTVDAISELRHEVDKGNECPIKQMRSVRQVVRKGYSAMIPRL